MKLTSARRSATVVPTWGQSETEDVQQKLADLLEEMLDVSGGPSLTLNLHKSEIHHHHHHYVMAGIVNPTKYQEGVYHKQPLLAGIKEQDFDDAVLMEAAFSQIKRLNQEITDLQMRIEESLRRMDEMERK